MGGCALLLSGGCSQKPPTTAAAPVGVRVSPSDPGPDPSKGSKSIVVEYREPKSSTKSGRKWRAIVVPNGISREELIKLARILHNSDSNSTFRFFDDDAKYEEYRLHDENYPSPQYPSPESWLNKHYIGLLNKIQDRRGSRWELWAMDGGFHLLPSGEESQTIAVID
jgi:hypothetical protein